jgi:membrane protein DedA with SNARE-associated domain
MEFMDQAISWLQQLPPLGVLALMFFIAYIENVFPPSPSDVLIIFTGTLVGIGTVDFTSALAFATAGSTLGFMTSYVLGRYFEQHLVSGRLSRYLPVGAINQVASLFKRYGYGVIVANRFLAGTRAIVSVFAGMSKMNLAVTTLLSAISAAVWNSILLYLGVLFANNWRKAGEYLTIYSKFMTVLILGAMGILIWRYFRKRRAAANAVARNE